MFSIQQVVSSSVELLMCIFIVSFFRRLHAKRVKAIAEDKESEALKNDDEMMSAREDKDEENDDDDNTSEIKMDEIHS